MIAFWCLFCLLTFTSENAIQELWSNEKTRPEEASYTPAIVVSNPLWPNTNSFCKTETNTKKCPTTASDYIEMNMCFCWSLWPNILPRHIMLTEWHQQEFHVVYCVVCSKADWRHGALSTTATLIKLASSYGGTSDANIIWICVSLTMMPPPPFATYSCTLCLCKVKICKDMAHCRLGFKW